MSCVSPACGTWCIITGRAYTACLRGQLSSNVRHHKTSAVALPPLEFNTARLAFRIWRDDHRPAFAAMNSDAEVMRYFPSTQTQDQSNATVDAWLVHFRDHGWGNWAVELLDTGEFIGFIGLNIPRRKLPFSPCTEVGWRLKPTAWGRGYATEGAKACLKQAFTQLGLAEVVSFTALVNAPSIAVMKRIGMENANADFEHPGVPEGSSLRPHGRRCKPGLRYSVHSLSPGLQHLPPRAA